MPYKLISLFCISAIFLTSACTSSAVRSAARSQEAAFNAKEAVAAKRLEFVDKYLECVTEAGENEMMVEACDTYLRSAEALS